MSVSIRTESILYQLIWLLMEKGIITSDDLDVIQISAINELLDIANAPDISRSARSEYLEAAGFLQKMLNARSNLK